MPAKRDFAGVRFGRLLVVNDSGKRSGNGQVLWNCRCDCGNDSVVRTDALKTGRVVSCGCHKNDMAKQNFTKHGMYQAPLYKRWQSMKTRCCCSSSPSYHNYGGRGIHVCRLWRKSFEAFKNWALKAGFREDLDIDRIDNNGPYGPWNCRFIIKTANSLNKRATGVYAHKNGRFYPHVKAFGKRTTFGGFATYTQAKTIRETKKQEVLQWLICPV